MIRVHKKYINGGDKPYAIESVVLLGFLVIYRATFQ